MVIRSNIVEAVTSLTNAKQRSILALIGIIVGIGSVIAMVSVGAIVQKEALRQFLEMGTDIVMISKQSANTASRQRKKQNITLKNALDIPAKCLGVRITAPFSSVYGTFKFGGKKNSIPALGITSPFQSINKLKLKKGRFIHALDTNMMYCVIGEKVEKKLLSLGATNLVGTRIIFKDTYFTIIGVIERVSLGGMRPYEINEGIMAPVSTLKRIFRKAEIKQVLARMNPGFGHLQIKEQIQSYYLQHNRLAVSVRTAEELIAQMKKQMRLFTLLLGTIGSISLIVGGIGVMNVMLVSVTERTREIGIRRALGARQGDIQFQFLVESIILCFIGGIIGIGVGVGVSYIICFYAHWQFFVEYASVILGVVVAVTVGIFFGFYPARQAARLNPIMALRSE